MYIDTTVKKRYSAGMKRVTLLLPDDLHAQFVAYAKAQRRSMQGQLLTLIEAAVQDQAGAEQGEQEKQPKG